MFEKCIGDWMSVFFAFQKDISNAGYPYDPWKDGIFTYSITIQNRSPLLGIGKYIFPFSSMDPM